MWRWTSLALSAVVFLAACQIRTGGGGPDLTYNWSTRYKIPGDKTNELNAFFYRDKDGKFQYAVLRYGWFQDLIEWSGGRSNPGEVKFDGNKVTVPLDGAVYIVDPALQLHRLSITADDLHMRLQGDGLQIQVPGAFAESPLWRDELLPVLKQRAWQRPEKRPEKQ
jgi:hypothetical protein